MKKETINFENNVEERRDHRLNRPKVVDLFDIPVYVAMASNNNGKMDKNKLNDLISRLLN